MMVEHCGGRWSSMSNCRNQTASVVALAMPLYSASALEQETVFYRLEDQLTRSAPRKTAKPEVDLRESGHPA